MKVKELIKNYKNLTKKRIYGSITICMNCRNPILSRGLSMTAA